jgi:hypothetical protein
MIIWHTPVLFFDVRHCFVVVRLQYGQQSDAIDEKTHTVLHRSQSVKFTVSELIMCTEHCLLSVVSKPTHMTHRQMVTADSNKNHLHTPTFREERCFDEHTVVAEIDKISDESSFEALNFV